MIRVRIAAKWQRSSAVDIYDYLQQHPDIVVEEANVYADSPAGAEWNFTLLIKPQYINLLKDQFAAAGLVVSQFDVEFISTKYPGDGIIEKYIDTSYIGKNEYNEYLKKKDESWTLPPLPKSPPTPELESMITSMSKAKMSPIIPSEVESKPTRKSPDDAGRHFDMDFEDLP